MERTRTPASAKGRKPTARGGDRAAEVDGKAPPQDPWSSHVCQALAAQRIEDLTRENAELKATRSELQYDLNASTDTLAEARLRAAVVERDNEALREKVHRQAAAAEHDREELRELAKLREQHGDLQQRLAIIVHQRKSLRGELHRRAQLLGRTRGELRGAQDTIAHLRHEVRVLERDRWSLQNQTAQNKVLRSRITDLDQIVEQLREGFRAVLASRRWRLGGALLFLPRRLMLRPKGATVPDAMLGLSAGHRARRMPSHVPDSG